ncbi:hypothetical protein [Enterovirga aerilata]|uniref:hypothetical protein n=1 Tax=Enterovirga aerilata TaxID=2730920 RepID=UPI001FEDC184|nr:hypothetical protein [Enterovirga sp. DB1703]
MTRAFGPAMIEKIRLGYADLDTPLDETAAKLGVHRGTIVRLAQRCGWPKRREASAALRRPPAKTDEADELDPSGQLARLNRISARTIAGLDAELSAGETKDPERTARALATHVRTLGSLKKLQAERSQEPEADDEPPPRTLAELRDELRRHLERICEEEEDDCDPDLRGDAEPG